MSLNTILIKLRIRKPAPIALPKGLTEILSSFTQTIADLNDLERRNSTSVKVNDATIASLQSRNSTLTTEANQAAAVRENIAKLITIK